MIVIKNLKHSLHNPKEELSCQKMISYFETPLRIKQIEKSLNGIANIEYCAPENSALEFIKKIHTAEYIDYIGKVSGLAIDDEDYRAPYVIPLHTRKSKTSFMIDHLAHFAMDTTTPIGKYTFECALHSADIAVTGAYKIIAGAKKVYSLCRPPGHHAEPFRFGGYCYFNNAGAAAQLLSEKNIKTTILDIDYHHGNGTQEIFYERADVQYISIHADPRTDYPYYSGFEDERGADKGLGFNINLPVNKNIPEKEYFETLEKALDYIRKFKTEVLIVSLGVDTYCIDPVGGLKLSYDSFTEMGKIISQINLPILVVQEGGYNVSDIGILVTNFLNGCFNIIKS